jgi:hypothetical protein
VRGVWISPFVRVDEVILPFRGVPFVVEVSIQQELQGLRFKKRRQCQSTDPGRVENICPLPVLKIVAQHLRLLVSKVVGKLFHSFPSCKSRIRYGYAIFDHLDPVQQRFFKKKTPLRKPDEHYRVIQGIAKVQFSLKNGFISPNLLKTWFLKEKPAEMSSKSGFC